MINTLFTGWHWMRWVRLVLGIVILIQAIVLHDMLLGGMASFILFQAVANVGCCGVNTCASPTVSRSVNPSENITFEEVQHSKL